MISRRHVIPNSFDCTSTIGDREIIQARSHRKIDESQQRVNTDEYQRHGMIVSFTVSQNESESNKKKA